MQPNVHNEQVLVQIQLLYNVHPNDKDNMLEIVFHPKKNQFHRIKHDIKLVVMFLEKHIYFKLFFSKIQSTLNRRMTI